MVAKIARAAGDAVTDERLGAFLALPTAESQLVYLCDLVQQGQTAFNNSTPPPDLLLNRVAVVPQGNGIVAQANFPLADNAPTMALALAVLPLTGLAVPKLAAGAGDTVTDPVLVELLALPNLESQVVWLAARIQASEAAYNVINPSTPQNSITLAPNYDLRSVVISCLLPLASGGLASLVGTLPY